MPTPTRLRLSDSSLLTVSHNRLNMAGDRSFSRFAPQMWNDLPLHITSTDKLNNFKTMLKLHLLTCKCVDFIFLSALELSI